MCIRDRAGSPVSESISNPTSATICCHGISGVPNLLAISPILGPRVSLFDRLEVAHRGEASDLLELVIVCACGIAIGPQVLDSIQVVAPQLRPVWLGIYRVGQRPCRLYSCSVHVLSLIHISEPTRP